MHTMSKAYDLFNYVSCAWCPENKFNYLAPFATNGMMMTALSFNNGFFEGTFDGNARTGDGKIIKVTNGKFRIKLAVYRIDI